MYVYGYNIGEKRYYFYRLKGSDMEWVSKPFFDRDLHGMNDGEVRDPLTCPGCGHKFVSAREFSIHRGFFGAQTDAVPSLHDEWFEAMGEHGSTNDIRQFALHCAVRHVSSRTARVPRSTPPPPPALPAPDLPPKKKQRLAAGVCSSLSGLTLE
jgi:hypothetical protein